MYNLNLVINHVDMGTLYFRELENAKYYCLRRAGKNLEFVFHYPYTKAIDGDTVYRICRISFEDGNL